MHDTLHSVVSMVYPPILNPLIINSSWWGKRESRTRTSLHIRSNLLVKRQHYYLAIHSNRPHICRSISSNKVCNKDTQVRVDALLWKDARPSPSMGCLRSLLKTSRAYSNAKTSWCNRPSHLFAVHKWEKSKYLKNWNSNKKKYKKKNSSYQKIQILHRWDDVMTNKHTEKFT